MDEVLVSSSSIDKIFEITAICKPLLEAIGKLAGALEGPTTAQNFAEALESNAEKLNTLLSSINDLLDPCDIQISKIVSAKDESYEGQYLRHVITVLEDFQATLARTEGFLKPTRPPASLSSFIGSSTILDELVNLTKEVESFLETLQLCPQMISICKYTCTGGPYPPGVIVQMSTVYENLLRTLRSDRLTLWICGNSAQRKEVLSRLKKIHKHFDEHATSACVLISSATTSSDPEFSINESVFGDTLTRLQGTRKVKEWLPGPSTEISRLLMDDNSRPRERSINSYGTMFSEVYPRLEKLQVNSRDSDSDIDDSFPATLYNAGCHHFERKEYALAERFLSKSLEEYHSRGHSNESPENAQADEEDDISHGDILKAKQMLAHVYIKQGKWEIGVTTLQSVVKELKNASTKAPLTREYLELVHQLAMTYYEHGNIDSARASAEEASRGRKRILGKHHKDFHAFIELLALTCEVQGDIYKATHYRSFLNDPMTTLFIQGSRIVGETEISTAGPEAAFIADKRVSTPNSRQHHLESPNLTIQDDNTGQNSYEPSEDSSKLRPIVSSSTNTTPTAETQTKSPIFAHGTSVESVDDLDAMSEDLPSATVSMLRSYGLASKPNIKVIGMDVYLEVHDQLLRLQQSENRKDKGRAKEIARWYFMQLSKQSGQTHIYRSREKINLISSHVRTGCHGLASIPSRPESARVYYNVLHFYVQLDFNEAVSHVLMTIPRSVVDIRDKCDVSRYNICRKTALDHACDRRHEPTITALLIAKASVNKDHLGALVQSNQDTSELIKKVLCYVEQRVYYEIWSGLLVHGLRSYTSHPLNIHALLQVIPIMTSAIKGDRSPSNLLHRLCESPTFPYPDPEKIVQLILETGLNPNQHDLFGKTPLDLAFRKSHKGLMMVLLDHKAKLSTRKYEKLTKELERSRKRFSLRAKSDPQDPRIILLKTHVNGYPEFSSSH